MQTSGVSLDEEMTNLVRFQRGYQASARAMSTFDEMLDGLINRTGRVGL
jgi:flagellar hook-associated protein 1 FlgK